MKKSIILCLSILLIALTGCNKDKNTWGKLEQGAITINVGDTYQLTFAHDGNVKPIWASANTDIATVDENGLVTGVRVGMTIVSVNGLECTVTVTDQFNGKVIEPIQNWVASYEAVDAYMIKNFGNIAIPELEYDTIFVELEEEEYDTIPYVSKATYDYSAIIEDHFADKYTYEFVATKDNEVEMASASMTIASGHVAEIPTYLNNRYILTDDFYKVANAWGYNSYIYNNSPDILFRASQQKN